MTRFVSEHAEHDRMIHKIRIIPVTCHNCDNMQCPDNYGRMKDCPEVLKNCTAASFKFYRDIGPPNIF